MRAESAPFGARTGSDSGVKGDRAQRRVRALREIHYIGVAFDFRTCGAHDPDATNPHRRRRQRLTPGAGRTIGAASRVHGRRRPPTPPPRGRSIADAPPDHRHHGRRPARHGRPRGGQAVARGRLQASDHHADRPRFRRRHGDRPGGGRQRLHRQAVPLRGAAGAHPRADAPARGERGGRVPDRPLHLPAGDQDCCSTPRAASCG